MEHADWQVNNNLSKCIKFLLTSQMYCDVTFKVGREGQLMKTHKLVLTARSPVFERMFYGSMSESTDPIVIPDIEPDGFASLLRYCYYDCEDIDIDSVLETLSAAKKYIVPALEEHCRDILTNRLSEDLVWPVYTWGLKEGDVMVCQLCREYIGEDIETVSLALQSPNLLTASRETLIDMLRLNHPIKDGEEKEEMGSAESRGQGDLAECLKKDNGPDEKEKKHIMDHKLEELSPVGILISEIELFKSCDKWAEAECGRQELKPTGENKRHVLGDCFSLICFTSMLLDDIVNVVSPSGVLSVEEKFALVEHLCGSTASESEPSGKYPIRNQKVLVQTKTSAVSEMPVKIISIQCSRYQA